MVKNRRLLKSIADERVGRLLDLAKDRTVSTGGGDRLSRRYVSIAESMMSRYGAPSGRDVKSEVCSKCKSVLVPGVNCSVRLASEYGYIVYRCRCGEEKHVFYRK